MVDEKRRFFSVIFNHFRMHLALYLGLFGNALTLYEVQEYLYLPITFTNYFLERVCCEI